MADSAGLRSAGHDPGIPEAAFYCVADERYFLGAVGLINSLRLVGHTEPIHLLDCGLSPAQRELLAEEATVVPAPSDAPPYLLKTVAPLSHPATVRVLIDADMIVTRPLMGLINSAREGRVIAFENNSQRFVADWGELLDLGTARRQAYVCSGLFFLAGSLGEEVLRLLDDRQTWVDFDLTYFGKNLPDYPFLFPEQDVLNAILSTRVPPRQAIALDYRLAPMPPFEGLRVIDEEGLRCAYEDGTEPYVVHHYAVKPWLEPTYEGVYSRLLRRLLAGSDVALRVKRGDVPLRLRTGWLARLEQQRVNAREQLRWRLEGRGERRSAGGGAGGRQRAANR